MTNEANQQQVQQNSTVDNRGANYAGLRDIYNAPVTHQTIVQDKSVTYSVDREDVKGLERLSKFVLEFIGELNAKVAAAVALVLGGGGILVNTSPAVEIPTSFRSPILLASMLLLVMGAALVTLLQFKAKSRCAKCNTFYAMAEHGEPRARETPRRGGVQRSTTRFYKCKNCGYETSDTENEFVPDEPSEVD